MKNNRAVVLVMALGVVLVAVLLWSVGNAVRARQAAQFARLSNAMPLPVMDMDHVSSVQGAGATQLAPVDAKFQKWIRDEARASDEPGVDLPAKNKEMLKVAKELTPSNKKQLLQTAQNSAAPSRERILSTYILAEAGERAQTELKQMIVTPVGQSAQIGSDAQAGQERSLRILAVEGFLSHAEGNPSVKGSMAKIVPEIQDDYVRKYAERRLNELK